MGRRPRADCAPIRPAPLSASVVAPSHADDAQSSLKRAIVARAPCDLGPVDALNEKLWLGRDIDARAVAEQIHQADQGKFRFELNGAHIRGRLSLLDVKTEVPLRLTSCWIDGGLDLDFDSVSDISLAGSVLGTPESWWEGWGLSGRFVTMSGDLCLAAARVAGGCRLIGATIKGSLDAPGVEIFAHDGNLIRVPDFGRPTAHLQLLESPPDPPPPGARSQEPEDPGFWAVNLKNANVNGDLVLKLGRLRGGITLEGATVTGQVNLRSANIEASGRAAASEGRPTQLSEYCALWAQGCHIGASILANPYHEERSVFTGHVSLVSARVDRSVFFYDADFRSMAGTPVVTRKPTSANFGRDTPQIGLDLFSCKIGARLNLAGATCSTGRQVDLRNCVTDSFNPGDSLWQDGLYGVSGLTYRALQTTVKHTLLEDKTVTGTGRARAKWIKKAVDGDRPGPYLTLAGAARTDGASREELKAKIRASSAAAHSGERIAFGWVRYGYRPYLVAIPILLLALGTGLLVNYTRHRDGFARAVVDGKEYTPATCAEAKLHCLVAPLFAIDAVIPVDQHQVSTWRPDRRRWYSTTLFWLVSIDRLAAWLLTGVFVAAVAGFLKRT